MIHFDTNFLIQALVPGTTAEAQMQGWLGSGEDLGISTIAWAEFLCGPLNAQSRVLADQLFSKPEPFLQNDAEQAAQLFNQGGRRSRSLPDCMIAATAIRLGAKLATHNRTDFSDFQGRGLEVA